MSQGASTEPTPSLLYTSIYNAAREALSYRSGFLRYNLQDIRMLKQPIKIKPFNHPYFP